MKIDNLHVWVFDLDDTLYSELEYQHSGYSEIRNFVLKIYGVDVSSVIDKSIRENKDVLAEICSYLKLPASVKESFLWIYRLHTPNITLYSGVNTFLNVLESNCLGIMIITDGRSISQRQKVISLGLDRFDVLVSEEWQESKPEPRRFNHVERLFPNASGFVYVGDNIKKDFVTPNKLDWVTIGLIDSGSNIHSQDIAIADDSYLPKFWVNNIFELQDFLC